MTPVKPFLTFGTEVLANVRTFFGPAIQAQAQRAANAAALERRRQELALEVQSQRSKELARAYPLGSPGRLRMSLPRGLAPRLLVSPVHYGDAPAYTVPNTVSDHVRRVDKTGKFLQVVSGAFVRDDGRLRELEGAVQASEIADCEFSPSPSVVVYFEQSAEALTVAALLTHVIHTLDGSSSVVMPLARLTQEQLEYASWRRLGTSEVDLEWLTRRMDRDGAGRTLEILAQLGADIATFTLAITSLYWALQGVRWRVPASESTLAGAVPQMLVHGDVSVTSGALAERVEQELAGLIAAGIEVEVCDLPDDERGFGILAPLGSYPRSVFFIVRLDYPRSPPELLLRQESGDIARIQLDNAQWEPARSLASLIEVLL